MSGLVYEKHRRATAAEEVSTTATESSKSPVSFLNFCLSAVAIPQREVEARKGSGYWGSGGEQREGEYCRFWTRLPRQDHHLSLQRKLPSRPISQASAETK